MLGNVLLNSNDSCLLYFLRLIKQYYLNCAFSHLCLQTQVQFPEHRQNESKRKHAVGAAIYIETLSKASLRAVMYLTLEIKPCGLGSTIRDMGAESYN